MIVAMVGGASRVLAGVSAGSAIIVTALFLGGYPIVLHHERAGLMPLIAGMGAAVAHGYRTGGLSRAQAAAAAVLLCIWVLFLKATP